MRVFALSVLAALSLNTARAEEATEKPEAPQAPITFGLARVYGADAAARDGAAIERFLSENLKRPVRSQVFESYESLAKALRRQQVDVAWITPLALVKALRGGNVTPLAKAQRHGQMYYRSCLFVREGQTYDGPASLKGRKAAWVDASSASGYLLPNALVMKAGQKTKGFFASEKFVGSHRDACNAVASGEADVGGTYTDGDSASPKPVGCIDGLGEAAAAKLRCVAASDRVPNEVIAAREGLDEQLASDLTGIFSGLNGYADGKKLLSEVFRAESFGFALEEDFDGVRELSLDVETDKSDAKPAKGGKGK